LLLLVRLLLPEREVPMLKTASQPKAKGRPIHLMPKEKLAEYLTKFDQHTKCEDALNELKRAVATLGVLRDAAENGECFDGKGAL
jgi:hypothetical protein